MALISCPECGKQISDKATSCPNCGCPVGNREPNTIVKNSKSPLIFIIIGILCVVIVIVGVVIINSQKKSEEIAIQRQSDLDSVIAAIDRVDTLVVDLDEEIQKNDIFLYGDPVSSAKKDRIETILNNLTDSLRIVDEAYTKQDSDFISEVNSYIYDHKQYRSWQEYRTALDNMFNGSITNEQAADNIVKGLASSEQEYRDYKNGYLIFEFEKVEAQKLSRDNYGYNYYYYMPGTVTNKNTIKIAGCYVIIRFYDTSGKCFFTSDEINLSDYTYAGPIVLEPGDSENFYAKVYGDVKIDDLDHVEVELVKSTILGNQ